MRNSRAYCRSTLLLAAIVLVLGCGMALLLGCRATPRESAAEMHAAKLVKGHLAPAGSGIEDAQLRWDPLLGVPYHLSKLIQMGPEAAPVLVRLLGNGSPTHIKYFETLEFRPYGTYAYGPERRATVGDLADYGLRVIYNRDVGYRSYIGKTAREETIQKWLQVIREERREAG